MDRSAETVPEGPTDLPRPLHDPAASGQPPDVAWRPGEWIEGIYEVLGVLGEGGMGRVYRVHHRAWNMDLAVKCILPSLVGEASRRDAFVREAETWVELGLHPHIVTCYYVRELDGTPRVFAEFVEGGSLFDWIRSGRLYEGGPEAAQARVCDVAIQIAWALAYAHAAGLVHQDVKPANVMMKVDGTALLADFGLAQARAAGTALAGGAEVTGAGLCTPAYASPEQLEGRPLARSTDVWSWAMTVMHMWAGDLPPVFNWRLAREVLDQLGREPSDAPPLPSMSAALRAALEDCFTLDPQRRPSDLNAVADRLRAVPGVAAREPPRPADLLADNLNNRAISYLDLGRPDDALRSWDRALQLDPRHPESLVNRGVWLWRRGAVTDEALVQEVQALGDVTGDRPAPQAWLDSALEAIQRARGDLPGRSGLDIRPFTTQSIRTPHGSVRIVPGGAVALIAEESIIGVWNIAQAARVGTLSGHNDTVHALSLCADGRLAASAAEDATVRVWELESERCVHVFEGHEGRIWSVALSPAGRFVASAGADYTVRVRDLTRPAAVRLIEQHDHEVLCVAFSGAGRLLASGSRDGTVRLWDVPSLRCVRVLEDADLAVSLCFIRQDRELVAGSRDGGIRVWDLAAGGPARVLAGHQRAGSDVVPLDQGMGLISAGGDGTVRLWDTATARCVRTVRGILHVPFGVAVSSGFALITGESGTWRLGLPRGDDAALDRMGWRLCRVTDRAQRQARERRFRELLDAAARAASQGDRAGEVALVREARALEGYAREPAALAAWRGLHATCRRTALTTGWMEVSYHEPAAVTAVDLSHDGDRVASGNERGGLAVRDRASLGRALRSDLKQRSIEQVRLSADGQRVLVVAASARASEWNLVAGREHRVWEFGQADVVDLELDSDLAVTAGYGTSLTLYDTRAGVPLRTLTTRQGAASKLDVDRPTSRALGGGTDGSVTLWSLSDGSSCLLPARHTSAVTAVVLADSGRLGITASLDSTVRIWDLEARACIHVLEGHASGVTALTATPDGAWILSASWDGTVRVWDRSGCCAQVLSGHEGAVLSVAVSSDAMRVATGGLDGTVRVWALDWELEAEART